MIMVPNRITLLTAHTFYIILLSMLLNLMVVHGHTPTDLLRSTIVSIPKDNKASLYK